MMRYQKFYVNKTTDTSADTLLALGFAELAKLVLKKLDKPSNGIVIQNIGEAQEITLPVPISEEELTQENLLSFPVLRPLISSKQDEKQGKKGRTLQDGFNYDQQWEKQKQLVGQLKSLPGNLRTPEARRGRDPELEKFLSEGPSSDFPHYQTINALHVTDTFNEIALRWQQLSASQQWFAIRLLFRLFSQQVNDIDAAFADWNEFAQEQHIKEKANITALQVINPTTGKGANAAKSNRLNSGGMDSFWLLELLKFRGFMIGAAPYKLTDGKDRKTYTVLPQKVELETLATIMRQFRRICWSSTAIKQDILASLRLTQVLVDHREAELTSRTGFEEWEEDRRLISIVRGFDVTFYKDMGSAHATLNVSTINIPNWFPSIDTLQQVEAANLLLSEHVRVIRRIEGPQGKEGNSELELLRVYRNFLSGHDLRSFWTFAALYGIYLFRQRDHEKDVKRWLPQLTKKGLDTLTMIHQKTEKPSSTILENKGFQSIASAIREATVRAQRRTSQEKDMTYEVRYGLSQELMRKTRNRDEFLITISEFISLYNTETAREEEKLAKKLPRPLEREDYRKYKLRYPVTTSDMQKFTQLLDSHPTELVAKMLIAYGSCRLDTFKQEEAQADIVTEDLQTEQE